jgi:hypothetical protein
VTEKVLAVHKVTGLITSVLPSEIEAIPALELASERQIKAAQAKRETEVFGAPIKYGKIPEAPVAPETEDTKVTSKDGADNG